MCPISSPTVRRSGSHAAIVFVLGVLSGVPTGPMAAQTYAMKTTAAVDYIATRARLDEEGRYTGETEFYAYGPAKGDAMRAIAAERGIDLSSSYAYSDSATDLPMLEVVGHPVVVNPDRELLRAAQERDWPVVHFTRRVRLRDRMPVPARP